MAGPLTSRRLFALVALFLPPLAIPWLWLRPMPGRAWWQRMLVKVLGTVALTMLSVLYLVYFFGLRMEMAGSKPRPIFSFGSQEARFEAVERQRAEQGEGGGIAGEAVMDAEWPGFRGPRGNGIVEAEIATSWPDGKPPQLWKQPIGAGYSTFVVAGGVAYTLEQRREQEVAVAYDLRTGRELWTHGWDAFFQEPMGGDGPRAAPTWNAGELLVLGAAGELRVLRPNANELVWRTNILEDAKATNLEWGMSAAPVVVDDLVITLPGGPDGWSVVAYERATGEIAWHAQDDRQSYTTPEVMTLAGKRQLVVVSAKRAVGLEIADGSLLWDYPWVTEFDINAAQPLRVDDEHFFLSAGYDHGAALVRITTEGEGFTATEVWQKRTMKNTFSSSILLDDKVYGLDAEIFACIDVRTGQRLWKGGRYGSGEVLLAGEHLVVSTEAGEIAIVEANPERHVEVARFEAIEGKTWNHPVLVDGILLVRNHREMAAFDLSPR